MSISILQQAVALQTGSILLATLVFNRESHASMPRTIVDIYLPWTFVDEGTYKVSLDRISAIMSIKYFPSQGRLAQVTGLSAAITGLHPDDPHGIVNFSSIVIEIHFLV